jgi:ubiquinone/menaquinone biosynthesis C-methylase UbiE
MLEMMKQTELPGHDLRPDKMPGHWLLAQLGKRVLRPGGRAMTCMLLKDLSIGPDDDVVEFAPGLGITARMILQARPRSYVGIERDVVAAAWTSRHLTSAREVSLKIGQADRTELNDNTADAVVGEAMLSMNPPDHKMRIVKEAHRILRPQGAYAIHELAIIPDEVPSFVKEDIEKALSAAIHVGARPLTAQEWCQLLESAGFKVERMRLAPMNLLQPARLIADEGLWGALRFIKNVLKNPDARRRVLTMRRAFHKHRAHLSAISIIARRRPTL